MYILIVRNNDNKQAMDASLTLAAYFASQNFDFTFVDSSTLYHEALDEHRKTHLKTMPDLAIVLGGDGTILHTAHLLQGTPTPILGINFGHLGFLANDSELGLLDLVTRALAGELVQEQRSALVIQVETENTDEIFEYYALNEAAITRGELGRTITYSLDISDNYIADVSGDGLILATATGSTAYSLAAGGPLVNPAFSGMIVQPLAPHTLTARAILTDPSDVVCVDLTKNREGRHATLFIDGDLVKLPSAIVKVYAKTASERITLLYDMHDHFYKYAAKTFFE